MQTTSQPAVKYGAVAIQQALRYVFGLTLRAGAALSMITHRSYCSHVYAKPGSNVAQWSNRKPEVQQAAGAAAAQLLNQCPDKSLVRYDVVRVNEWQKADPNASGVLVATGVSAGLLPDVISLHIDRDARQDYLLYFAGTTHRAADIQF